MDASIVYSLLNTYGRAAYIYVYVQPMICDGVKYNYTKFNDRNGKLLQRVRKTVSYKTRISVRNNGGHNKLL